MSHSENFKYKCDCEYCEKRRITCKKRYKPVTSPKKRGRKPKCASKLNTPQTEKCTEST